MTTINYKSGTKVWVRLDGKRKLAVFKEQLPELWGGASLQRHRRIQGNNG